MHTHTRSIIAATGMVLALLAGCSVGEPDPEALLDSSGRARYADGTFAVAYDYASQDGWRPFIQLAVRSGVVRNVCFDAVAIDGRRMLADDFYVESYRLATGIQLRELITTLADCLLQNQQISTGSCAPETEWSTYFTALARTALAASAESETGRTGTRPVESLMEALSMAGPYTVTDQPDELGWVAELAVTFRNGRIESARYNETRVDHDGQTAVKIEQEEYLSRYQDVIGTDYAEVVQSLLNQLSAGDPPDQLDAVWCDPYRGTIRTAGSANI